jgi:hypothetical protein
MSEMEHKCSKCGHTDNWKEKSDKLKRSGLNDLFYDITLNEICGGDQKKFRAWLAKYATRNQKDFMKEWAKLQPKDMKIEKTTTLNYIRIGAGKETIPGNLPVVVDGEETTELAESPDNIMN